MIQFGYCVPIFAMPGPRLFRTPNYAQLEPVRSMALARRADALGYHSLWVADHLMLGRDDAILEGWTTLAALAGATQRARLGMIHQAHYFRHPALAAKMIATLDQISGGRFIFFADPAYGRAEHRAYGLPYPDDAEERIAATAEGVELALALWQSDEPVSFDGHFYRTEDAACHPRPLQQPHPPVWFGEAHPHTLANCARLGQGWNSVPVGYDALKERLAALASACQAAGRNIDEIERTLEIQILVVNEQAELRTALQGMADLDPSQPIQEELRAFLSGESDDLPSAIKSTWLIGTADEVSTQIERYVDLGISHFLLWFVDAPSPGGLELFAESVMPRFAR
ncbi:MAG: LLM class flavin-dependent oxidoreductase [Caldilineaceae bacterium]|nr:LLM class flavin-dependent oxidoreductase [Caldilineaceae bacterium]